MGMKAKTSIKKLKITFFYTKLLFSKKFFIFTKKHKNYGKNGKKRKSILGSIF